jgi:ATP-dependent exoDNAse (exonuclease V) beta subunit
MLAGTAAPATGGETAPRPRPEDCVYVQGVLDLLILGEEADGAPRALVLDYKTDRGAAEAMLLDRYSAQLRLYCRAVSALCAQSGRPRAVSWAIAGLDLGVYAEREYGRD